MFRVSLGREKHMSSKGKEARVREGGDRYREKNFADELKLISILALPLSSCITFNKLLHL